MVPSIGSGRFPGACNILFRLTPARWEPIGKSTAGKGDEVARAAALWRIKGGDKELWASRPRVVPQASGIASLRAHLKRRPCWVHPKDGRLPR